MKKRKFIIGKAEREKFLEVFTLLHYKVESETPRGEDLVISLIREKDDPEVSRIENEYIPKIIPIWTLLIPAVLVICIMTAYLIVHFGHLWEVDKFIKFLTFFIPAAVLLGVDVIIFFLRSHALTKIIKGQPELIKELNNRLKK